MKASDLLGRLVGFNLPHGSGTIAVILGLVGHPPGIYLRTSIPASRLSDR
jgi:hypothetical protein